MNNQKKIILNNLYLPPVEYFALMINSGEVLVESRENYQKQSYRNRCHIFSANGLLALNIPVDRSTGLGRPFKDTKIDYSENWQVRHWRAIVSAYKSSPFFDYYQDDLSPFYEQKENYLYDYNFKLINTVLSLLETKTDIKETDVFSREYVGIEDYRELIHPKKQPLGIMKNGQYHQVFAHKSGFLYNLSIIDLLFNEGPDSFQYLKI